MTMRKVSSFREAVRHAIWRFNETSGVRTKFLPKGRVIAARSNGECILVQGQGFSIKTKKEREYVVNSNDQTVVIDLSPGEEYRLEAKSGIHLTSLLKKEAA